MRKYRIDPENHTGNDTICETLREIWRKADALGVAGDEIKELAAKGFDFAKRMNDRLKQYKAMYEPKPEPTKSKVL